MWERTKEQPKDQQTDPSGVDSGFLSAFFRFVYFSLFALRESSLRAAMFCLHLTSADIRNGVGTVRALLSDQLPLFSFCCQQNITEESYQLNGPTYLKWNSRRTSLGHVAKAIVREERQKEQGAERQTNDRQKEKRKNITDTGKKARKQRPTEGHFILSSPNSIG